MQIVKAAGVLVVAALIFWLGATVGQRPPEPASEAARTSTYDRAQIERDTLGILTAMTDAITSAEKLAGIPAVVAEARALAGETGVNTSAATAEADAAIAVAYQDVVASAREALEVSTSCSNRTT